MSATARVLIVGETPGHEDRSLSEILSKHGFTSDTVAIASGMEACARVDRPDVVVLDLLNRQADAKVDQFVAFARQLKAETALGHIPVIAIGEDSSCPETAVDDIRNARVDEIIVGPLNEHQISGRLNALVRLNTMHEELVRRLNTSAKYGVDAPVISAPTREVDDATILVVGASETYPVIENTLARHATLIGALSADTALDYLTRRPFDAVLVDLDADPQPFIDLCRLVRRNSRLFNVPIVLLGTPATLDDPTVSGCEGVTDIVAKPIRPRELEARIVSLVAELRFRDSLRAIYKQARHMATSDGLTGLYSRGFLLEHLRNLIEEAGPRKGTFALAFLEIANIAAINAEYGYVVGDRIIRQVGEMMSYLVRGEDLTARYSGARYCVLLPDTSMKAAQVAIKRISGVVNSTELSAPDILKPINVDLICAISEFADDTDPQGMIDRVRSQMS